MKIKITFHRSLVSATSWSFRNISTVVCDETAVILGKVIQSDVDRARSIMLREESKG